MANIVGWLLPMLVLGTGTVQGSDLEHKLVEKLLTNYSVNVRPVEHWSQALNVTVDISLNQIIDLNERQQYVSLLLWIRVIWKDRNMVWDPVDYDGLNEIRLKMKLVWKPDIVLYNSLINFLDLEDRNDLVKVFADGTVFWGFPKVIQTLCPLNVQFFPWDTQVCVLKFGSWTHNLSQIDVYNISTEADINNFELNGEWSLRSMPCMRHAENYNMTNGSVFPDVTYYLIIDRRPLYTIFNLVLPCILIKATALLTFFLPPESGEKVSLNVTILLALTVFLLMVADNMPPQSFHVPLLGQYIAATIMLLSLSTACTVLVLRCHHRGVLRGQIPGPLRTFVFKVLPTILCMRASVDKLLADLNAPKDEIYRMSRHQSHQEVELTHMHIKNQSFRENGHPSQNAPPPQNTQLEHVHPEEHKGLMALILSSLRQLRSDLKGNVAEQCIRSEWFLVAYLLDRFLFVVFVVITVLVSSLILCQYMYVKDLGAILAAYDIGTTQ